MKTIEKGETFVQGYTRKNGTHVKGYIRNRKPEMPPYRLTSRLDYMEEDIRGRSCGIKAL